MVTTNEQSTGPEITPEQMLQLASIVAERIGESIAARLERHFVVEPTVNLTEAAKALGISDQVMRQLCRERRIRAIRLDKSWRIRVRDLNEYLDQRTQEAAV